MDCHCYGTSDFDVRYCPMHKAAPDMLEALEEIVEQIRLLGILDWSGAEGLSIDKQIDAISKAKGA